MSLFGAADPTTSLFGEASRVDHDRKDNLPRATTQFGAALPVDHDRKSNLHRETSGLIRSLRTVLGSICRQGDCAERHDYAARVAISTYRNNTYGQIEMDAFLTQNRVKCSAWREVGIHAASPWEFKQQSCKSDSIESLRRVTCERTFNGKRAQEIRMNFKIEEDGLWEGPPAYRKRQFSSRSLLCPVSLGDMIELSSAALTERVKRIIAVYLGYAALYLDHLLCDDWTNSQVLFHRTGSSTLPLRPYIEKGLRSYDEELTSEGLQPGTEELNSEGLQSETDDFDLLHPFPALVALATNLIELFMGAPMYQLARRCATRYEQDQPTHNSRYVMAAAVFNACKEDICELPASAISLCLDMTCDSPLDSPSMEQRRRNVCKKVIRKLEEELARGYGQDLIDRLDELAPSIDLCSLGRMKRPHVDLLKISQERRRLSACAVDKCLGTGFGGSVAEGFLDYDIPRRITHKGSLYCLENASAHGYGARVVDQLDEDFWNTWSELKESERRMPGNRKEMARERSVTASEKRSPLTEGSLLVVDGPPLFDDVNSSKYSTPGLSDNFIRRMRQTYERFIVNPVRRPPVKIAILDSGLDLPSADLEAWEDRIMDVRSWVRGNEGKRIRGCGDETGHGTHAAALLLNTAPDAFIYVAQVATTLPTHPSNVAKAIQWAVNEWKVDMISMSFGYPSRPSDYSLLERAVRNAQHKDVLMFAAASNDGGNGGRAFPARQDEVICIYATDGNGNPSGFNPSPEEHRDNFSTLGEDIKSSWPIRLGKPTSAGICNIRKSGTSFATPIAAGIAAFLLLYVRQQLSQEEAEMIKHTAKMRAVLRLVAGPRLRNGFQYIAPNSRSQDNLFNRDPEHVRKSIQRVLWSS